MCVAKPKNVKMLTLQQIKNSLRYAADFSVVYNQNSYNFVRTNICSVEQYEQFINQNNITFKNAMLYKFRKNYNYYSNNESKSYNYPLFINSNYDKMIHSISTDSAIVFHDKIIGFENNQIENEKQFCKYASAFDRLTNNKIFKLSLGDNLAAILNNDGSIQLYGNEKSKKWEIVDGIYFSDNDYKYSGYNYYNNSNMNGYYNDDYYNDYYGYENNYYQNNNSTHTLVCDKCFKKTDTLWLQNGFQICDKCKQNKLKHSCIY